uniref:Uncharacterized protein n=1 Tax=Salvator merianae TaxID=96440 RepID=A0A8D0BUN3_SALMN
MLPWGTPFDHLPFWPGMAWSHLPCHRHLPPSLHGSPSPDKSSASAEGHRGAVWQQEGEGMFLINIFHLNKLLCTIICWLFTS